MKKEKEPNSNLMEDDETTRSMFFQKKAALWEKSKEIISLPVKLFVALCKFKMSFFPSKQ